MKKFLHVIIVSIFSLSIFSAGCSGNQKEESQIVSSKVDSINNLPENKKIITAKKQAENINPDLEAKELKTDDAVIAEIRTAYLQTQNLLADNKLRKDTKTYDCTGDPGNGSLLRYYEGEDLKLMIHQFGSEHYWFSKHIFLSNGAPYFIYEEEGTWGFSGPHTAEQTNTIDKITEQRYYLQNGKIVQHLKKSFEEKSWEAKPDRNKIANKKMKVKDGETYPLAAAIPLWIAGKVSCR